jgi:hypothetical protein
MADTGKVPFYKRKWFIVLMVLIVLGAIGSVSGTGEKGTTSSDKSASTSTATSSASQEQAETASADKTQLQGAYDNSGGMNKDDYTADSWKAFQKARKAAKKVLDDKNAMQDEVDKEHTKLTDAISALVEVLKPENYEAADYTAIARTPDDWKYKLVTFSGRVLQVSEGDGENLIRLATNGDWDDVVAVGYDPAIMGNTRILEDDHISVYGTCIGIYSYTATMGQTISVPGMYADHIVIN